MGTLIKWKGKIEGERERERKAEFAEESSD